MKNLKYLAFILILSNLSASGQSDTSQIKEKYFSGNKLSIEPGLGIKPALTAGSAGLLISNVFQWNLTKRFSIVSHTSYTYNNAFLRDFNFIETNYSFSLSQKIGIGTSFYGKHFTHTISLMAGIQSDNFKETLNNPEFERVEISRSSLSPDYGLLYSLKIGQKKYYFSYRMYIPLYPYPFNNSDINSVDGNISNISFEIGFGIRLK